MNDCILSLNHELIVSSQVALYIWDNGKGPHLTAVPELCTEPEDSPQAQLCATTMSREPPLCVSLCSVTLIIRDFQEIERTQNNTIKQRTFLCQKEAIFRKM